MDSSLRPTTTATKPEPTRPLSPLSFGLPAIPPNVNRSETNLKIKERESIRLLWRERRNTIKRFILGDGNADSKRQGWILAYTGTLLKNLYYVGNSYLIQSVKPNEKYTITENCIRKKNTIIHNIILLEKLICQAKKILETGVRTQQNFIASIQHLEAERVFTISTIRKEALATLLKPSSDSYADNSFKGNKNITINTIDCKVRMSRKCCGPMWNYYFFILRHGTTIYGSILAPADCEGNIVFKGPFIFKNILSGSVIKFQFYSIQLDFDFFMGPPERFGLPLMRLIGEFTIGLSSVGIKQCCVRPANASTSSNINDIFESLTVKCVKNDKTANRSMA